MLISGGLDCRIFLWNLNRAKDPLCVFEISEPVTSVSFLPDVPPLDLCPVLVGRILRERLGRHDRQTLEHPVAVHRRLAKDSRCHYISELLAGRDEAACWPLPWPVRRLRGRFEQVLSISFDSECRLTYIATISCRNRYGTYSAGRKVTGISFANNSEALVTTADSRLRMVNLDVFTYA